MNTGQYVFPQIMDVLPRRQLNTCVQRYIGDHGMKNFSCRDQFLAMAFGQLSYRASLRDTVACLRAHEQKRYHLGFGTLPTKSTLARANEQKDWRIYRDLADVLIKKASTLYLDEPAVADDIRGACYAIDSTSIELCLSLFPWASYVETKGAVKLHTVMDLRGSIPTFFDMTSGKVNDVNFLDQLSFESNAFYILDRGYLDLARLYRIHTRGAFFVTRAKRRMRLRRRYSNPVRKDLGILCDQVVRAGGVQTKTKYPDILRRIKYRDDETGHTYTFLTNNFEVSASSVALLYKNRWKIELFFKWIKQHLKIKTFWGYSENALKTQVCIALCTYLLVAILKKYLKIDRNLYEILQILSVSLFDKTPVVELFSRVPIQKDVKEFENTLPLFAM